MEKELERFDPELDDARINYEHYHRYMWASELVKGKIVLDLGCGEGFGSFILSKNARYVIGIDIDKDIIIKASRKYLRENLKFVIANALSVPFRDSFFDAVVCFEVLEHLKEQEKLIQQVLRVMKESGILIISTPDREIYRQTRTTPNPFHLKELSRSEFIELLRFYFPNIKTAEQKIRMGSEIYADKKVKRFFLEKSKCGFQESVPTSGVYLIAVASKSTLPSLPTSYLFDNSEHIIREVVDAMGMEIEKKEKEKQEIEGRFSTLKEEFNRLKEDFEELKRTSKENFEELRRIYKERVNSLKNQITAQEKRVETLEKVLKENLKESLEELKRQIGVAEKSLILDSGSYHGTMDTVEFVQKEITPLTEFHLLVRAYDEEKYRGHKIFARIFPLPFSYKERFRLLKFLRAKRYKRVFLIKSDTPGFGKFQIFTALTGGEEFFVWDGRTPMFRTTPLRLFLKALTPRVPAVRIYIEALKKIISVSTFPFKVVFLLLFYLYSRWRYE